VVADLPVHRTPGQGGVKCCFTYQRLEVDNAVRSDDMSKAQLLTMFAVLLLVTVGVSAEHQWGAADWMQPSLRDLPGVQVIVNSRAEPAGLSNEKIREDISLRLIEAGIPVMTQEQRIASTGAEYLQVGIDVDKVAGDQYAYYVRTELRQIVLLARNPALRVHATTWWVADAGVTDGTYVPVIQGVIREQVGSFLKACGHLPSSTPREPESRSAPTKD
jgi:hypothetical protein